MSENKTVLNEEVFLPSRGIIYPQEYGVPESVVISPFKTKDLKGLFGSNSQSAIYTLIKNCIVSDFNMDCKELHTNDWNALITRIRAITLGSQYVTKRECIVCHKTFDIVWDLNNIECKYLDFDEYPIPITLPDSGKNLSVGVVLPKEIRDARDLVNKRKEKFPDIDEDGELIFYINACMIKKIGNLIPSLESRMEFLLDCSPDDFGYLTFINTNIADFGIQDRKTVTCPHCSSEHTAILSVTEQFFRNTHELPAGIRVSKGVLGRNPTEAV